ncbi:MAG: hypothetical protein PHS93_09195 [Candidatus Omnitrophica bacterium]|nr:hypothetical protein [Candidatus Omnitrophota bacterium]
MINKKHKLTLIEWEDSYSTDDKWKSVSAMPKPKRMICVSVGWIIKETKNNILIIPHLSDINNKNSSGTGFGEMVIPKSAIRKRKELKP